VTENTTTAVEFEAVSGYGRIAIKHTAEGEPDKLFAQYFEDGEWVDIHDVPLALVGRWFTSGLDSEVVEDRPTDADDGVISQMEATR